jgi:hypothetical protein
LTRAVDVARGDPPLDAAYHWMLVPVAVRLATVGLAPEQKLCVALPVGAAGLFTVTATANREEDSQPLTV